MAIRQNSRPYPFRSFRGESPTTEQLRAEMEDVYKYLDEGIKGIQFSDVGGSFTSDQFISIDNRISSVVVGINADIAAQVTRVDTLEAIVLDPRTGLVASRAAITLEQTVRATLYTALAAQISTVSAQVGTSNASVVEERLARIDADGSITAAYTLAIAAENTAMLAAVNVEASARISADGTITANLSTEVTARTNGDNALSASIVAEAAARVTADGFVSAKYTLTVTASGAGINVVTGLNLTSSIDGGVSTSKVVFQASEFQIWNSTPDVGVAMFDISGSTIRLAGTLVVSTSGKMFIGTGTYANSNTAFYVDSGGDFSLKDKLVWDESASLLTIDGTITAVDGTIGGFALTSTTLSATGIMMDASAPSFRIGTSGSERVVMEIVSSRSRLGVYNSGGTLVGTLQGNDGVGNDPFFSLTDSSGTQGVLISGNGYLAMRDGSTSTPAYTFLSDLDTGLRWNSSGDFRVVRNGADTIVFRDVLALLVPLKLANTAVAETPVATHTITVQDLSGTTYRVLCLV